MVLGITSIDIGSFFVLDKAPTCSRAVPYPKSHLLIWIPIIIATLERVSNPNTSSEALCHVRYSVQLRWMRVRNPGSRHLSFLLQLLMPLFHIALSQKFSDNDRYLAMASSYTKLDINHEHHVRPRSDG
jgi:hypothetical protein